MTRFRWAALAPVLLLPLAFAFGADEPPEAPTIKSIMKVAFISGLAG